VNKPTALSATAALLGFALVVAGAAVARSQATEIQLATSLNATQEVPAPTGDVSAGRGTFSATVTKSDTGAVVSWQLSFSGLTGAAGAAHIHIAAVGQPGPVAVPLCGPCASPASGSANVDATVLSALETGGAYVNVHTAANAAGEIRGQLAVRASVTTALSARQEVPRPKGNAGRARATFTATVTKSGTSGTVAWRLSFSRLTGRAVAAHIHVGQRGKAGPVAVPLCGPCRSGARGNATVQASVLSALEAGRAYVNVHTPRNPAGEVRGQLAAVPLRISTS
jgi:CHRD domain-containing protein